MQFFLGTSMTRRSDKNGIFWGLQTGVALSGNIFNISLKAYSPIFNIYEIKKKIIDYFFLPIVSFSNLIHGITIYKKNYQNVKQYVILYLII